MLSKDHFYYGMIKKYAVAFNHIISDIHVIRTLNGVPKKDITVPTTYATKTKLFNYLARNSNINDKVSIILPRISFIINGMVPDPTRKISNLNTTSVNIGDEYEEFIYSGMPYNFNIDLTIWSKYVDDLNQIIEQIASFFKSDFVIDVNEIPELGITKRIPVELNDITFDIENEYEDTDRIVTAGFNFTLKGYVYPPVNNTNIVKHIYIKMCDLDSRNVEETIKIDWNELTESVETEIVSGDPTES